MGFRSVYAIPCIGVVLDRPAPRIDLALGNRVLRRSNQLLMHLPHRISAIGAIVGYLHAGHQHRITACSRNILVEKGDIAQIVTLEFLPVARSEEHTSELQSLMRISYAVFCLKKQKYDKNQCNDLMIYQT